MINEGFRDNALALFSDVAECYQLQVVHLSDGSMALVGSGFAIHLADDREAAVIDYLKYDEKKNNILSFPLTIPEIISRFTEKDLAQAIDSDSYDLLVLSDLRVFSSGLKNCCQDVLSGDESWLTRLQGKDPNAWSGVPLRDPLAAEILRQAPKIRNP